MDFMSKEVIIARYNIALDNFLKVKKIEDLHLKEKIFEFSRTSGDAIYEVIEWSLKRHLSIIAKKLKDKNKINITRYNQLLNNIRRDYNLHDLVDEMTRIARPTPYSTLIDWELILSQKYCVRNKPVHSGSEVDINALAKVIPEAKKIVLTYVDSQENLEDIKQEVERKIEDSNWDDIFAECYQFDTSRSIYVLVTAKLEGLDNDQMAVINKIKWSLVIDFDPASSQNGMFFAYKKHTGSSPHYITLHQIKDISLSKNSRLPYWFLANGDNDVCDTLATSQSDWRRRYTNPINQLTESFSRVFDRDIKVVIINGMKESIQTICNFFDVHCFDRVQFILLSGDSELKSELEDKYKCKNIDLAASELVQGILNYRAYFDGKNKQNSDVMFPGKDGNVVIPISDIDLLEEDLELLHIGKHYKDELEQQSPMEFYKGRQIEWEGLFNHYDIDRKRSKSIEDTIIQSLKKGENKVILLHHSPGVGGTTTSRRIAWNIHDTNPTVVLKQYREGITASNLVKLYRYTLRTIFVIAEVGLIGFDTIRKLFNETLQKTTPIVILAVSRTFMAPRY